jgi:hypothetical protein
MATTKYGILRPFRFTANGNPATGHGEDLRESRIGQVLATRRAGPRAAGELPWRHFFGSLIPVMRLSSFNDTRQALTYVYASDAIRDALPDEVLERIAVVSDRPTESVEITVASRLKQDVIRRGTQVAPTITVKRTS